MYRAKKNTEALQSAIAFEDGLKRQKSYGYISQEPKVKEEPICAVSKSNKRECWKTQSDHFERVEIVSECGKSL